MRHGASCSLSVRVTGMYVYFLINTCLTGLRSSEILSNEVSRVHHHRPDGEEREEKEREQGRWRTNTCGCLKSTPRNENRLNENHLDQSLSFSQKYETLLLGSWWPWQCVRSWQGTRHTCFEGIASKSSRRKPKARPLSAKIFNLANLWAQSHIFSLNRRCFEPHSSSSQLRCWQSWWTYHLAVNFARYHCAETFLRDPAAEHPNHAQQMQHLLCQLTIRLNKTFHVQIRYLHAGRAHLSPNNKCMNELDE